MPCTEQRHSLGAGDASAGGAPDQADPHIRCFFRDYYRNPLSPGRFGRPGVPRWVDPVLVGDIEYREYTGEGLRHPSWRGLRTDKDPAEVAEDRPTVKLVAHCRRCHGWLLSPRSVAEGIGPTCAARERAEERDQASAARQELVLFDIAA